MTGEQTPIVTTEAAQIAEVDRIERIRRALTVVNRNQIAGFTASNPSAHPEERLDLGEGEQLPD